MSTLTRILALAAFSLLAACTSPGGFSGYGGAGGAGGAGATGGMPAPGTVAYFNEMVGDRVHFAVDESALSEEAKSILIAQARWLNDNPEFNAIIEGHADEQGTREYNLALGDRRANAVRDFLIAQGVAPHRLRTVSYGKERPIAICSEEACYAQNRRAVTVLIAPGATS
ncbi:peptidoglycan-associated lipoprotein [Meinhardsimonia xiamenensis]|jgi:peptidoglycan-associated lipoprotein|uniref:Peptidoglycan-associated lipoprotein n=1 Tax=Meinhardsimonia xiamenensis TaxID=990712 RepID=A0A1G9B1I2_9RHOB|nr:peptidoglycan-associated lipoprotein Pal [Meinhardsimonia xiamenensis]PRX35159.1 peptidoglycan-associated lipoprotein [Meinhardsimonia xiamenensis]SDK33392.1 peptidoglycan-associated lipoprotein [Meinhardsimonia xiamenensis]